MQEFNYDIVVIGAGHAGCEAACACAKLGSKTLLITMNMNTIGQMSCNPAVGGIAKGQIVREIDALGGEMGKVTDNSSIQFRMLNKSKGPAVWSPRSQSDRKKFIEEWIETLTHIDNLYLWQDTATKLIIKDNKICAVETALGVKVHCQAVILTNGTFLNGLLHFGEVQIKGGRIAEPSSYFLTEQLKALGFTTGRLKTGTPARLDKRSIDFSKLVEQKGDEDRRKFSFSDIQQKSLKQMSCWITYTNTQTHEELRKGLEFSPLYNGQIKSIGPRYCPSIETKIVTFAEKEAHQLFLEPEGVDSNEYYVNGFSSSLPLEYQMNALHTIEGLEHCILYRPGYAIEYDFFDPTQLYHTLETKIVQNLFFAGQINGTTGYEEAAGQGIIAGINAHRKINRQSEFVLKREESYIGVLIDDLVTKGVDEPYRMFTSRAEYRILLRQDNADLRLTPKGMKIGLVDSYREQLFKYKETAIKNLEEFLSNQTIKPNEINGFLESIQESPIHQPSKLSDLILRPNVNIFSLTHQIPTLQNYVNNIERVQNEVMEETEINIKYKGYIEREQITINKMHRLENIKIPHNIEYSTILSLSTESRQKLDAIKPKTILEASRIPGVSPNDINVLLVKFGR